MLVYSGAKVHFLESTIPITYKTNTVRIYNFVINHNRFIFQKWYANSCYYTNIFRFAVKYQNQIILLIKPSQMHYFSRHLSIFVYTVLLFFISVNTWAQANTGIIKGVVTTSDGTAVSDVEIVLKNTTFQTRTTADGSYEIRRIPAATYLVQIRLPENGVMEKEIQVLASQTTIQNLQLTISEKELQEIIITSKRHSKHSSYAAKMPLKDLENPQVYQAVSSNLFKEQAITTTEDALKNVPGIQKIWESTGRGGDGGTFYSLRGFQVQANLVNGLPGLTAGTLDPSNIERIEVIKGPSGTLFGSSLVSYGGLINTVTKKPTADFAAEVSYIGGSFGLNRVTADVNAPVNKDVAVRINAAYQTENSFQDAGFRKSLFIAPVLSYKVNDKLSFLISTEFMQEEKTTPPMLLLGRNKPLQFGDIKELNYNSKLSFYSNDLPMKNPKYNLQAQMSYKLSDQWTSQSSFSRSSSDSNGYYSYLSDLENDRGEFGMHITREQSQLHTTDVQQNFIGDFKLGNMRNRVVAGLDYYYKEVVYGGTGYAWLYNTTLQGERNYNNPYTQTTDAPLYPTRSSIESALATTGITDANNIQRTYSAYVSDVLTIVPGLIGSASVRLDHFDNDGSSKSASDNYKQTVVSPKFGVIYQPLINQLSLFVNYMNGFKNMQPRTSYNGQGEPTGVQVFKPEQANQLEWGVKTSLFNNKLNATVSYYDIKVKNLVTSNINYSIQGGESQSRGFEADLSSSPLAGWNILAGFSYNNSKITKGDTNNIWLEEGKRPMWSGPENLINLWTTYTFQYGVFQNFGLGFGGNYASENAVVNSDLIGRFEIPSYTVLNASIFYSTKKFSISLNINNITNQEYFTGGWSTVNPQKPRNAVASFIFKF
jgi:iron complex outermembrane receptor protein